MKKIYIPSNLNLLTILDPEYHNNKDLDRFHYVINLIYEQRILYKNPEEYVPLKAIYMRRVIGRAARTYNEYINILINKQIIDCDRHYIKNEKSYGYRLCTQFSEVRHRQISITSPCLQTNINRWQNDRLPNTKVHNHLYKFLQEIKIDYEEACKDIDNLPVQEYNCMKISIDKINNKDFYIHYDDFGRVHTNLTNLKSSLRKFLFYRNQNLVNIDIANSQPLLLLISIPSIFTSIRCTEDIYFEDISPDVLRYKRLVERGKLYEYLMEHSGKTDRNSFKENFFRETFFGKRTSSLFCNLFPTIGEQIKKIKKKNYKRLAWLMQRKESKLIITKICGRIMEEHPDIFIGTIHDSILTTSDSVSVISSVIKQEFAKISLSPTIRTELT